MAVTFFKNSEAGLKKLDEYLLSRSYTSGYQASKDDILVLAPLSKAPTSLGVSEEYSGITIEGFASVAEEPVATAPAALTQRLQLLLMSTMLISLVRRLRRKRKLLKSVQQLSRHLGRRKSLYTHTCVCVSLTRGL